MSKEIINLPKAPKDLCFTELDFVQVLTAVIYFKLAKLYVLQLLNLTSRRLQKNFNVDTFLQEHRKNIKLEAMRDDLGLYLKMLRSAMIDLINRDYTDFVNLSSNLIGLDKAINDLQVPLGQLREEVMVKSIFIGIRR